MAIDPNLIDKLLADYKKPEDIIGENGLLKQLTKALLERAMGGSLGRKTGYGRCSARISLPRWHPVSGAPGRMSRTCHYHPSDRIGTEKRC